MARGWCVNLRVFCDGQERFLHTVREGTMPRGIVERDEYTVRTSVFVSNFLYHFSLSPRRHSSSTANYPP